LLFDASAGGGGTQAKQTTQTTSGNARGVSGDKNQYVESGSIGVGTKGKYQETGSFDYGSKNQFAPNTNISSKGSITVNDSGGATAIALLDKLTGLVGQPSSANSSPGQITPPTPTPGPTVGADATAASSTPGDASSNTSGGSSKKTLAIEVGAVLLLAVAVWFFFFRKR
jgi:hypothetical protein